MDMKELTRIVTSALESAPEASMEGEVRGIWHIYSLACGAHGLAAGTNKLGNSKDYKPILKLKTNENQEHEIDAPRASGSG